MRKNTRRPARSNSSYTRGGIALVAGAGIGMAMMYLLDPEAGERRRSKISKTAGRATHGARDVAQSAMEKLATAAGAMTEHLSPSAIGENVSALADAGQSMMRKVGDGAGGMKSQALSAGEQLYAYLRNKLASVRGEAIEHANDHMESARSAAKEFHHRANIALGREREHHYVGQTTCALGSLALGAGLVWMFDPRLGRSRRAWLRDKSFHWMNEVSDFCHKSGRHLKNRMQGTAAETRGYLRKHGMYPRPAETTAQPATDPAIDVASA